MLNVPSAQKVLTADTFAPLPWCMNPDFSTDGALKALDNLGHLTKVNFIKIGLEIKIVK